MIKLFSKINCGLSPYDDFLISDCSSNNFSVLDSSLPPKTSTQINQMTNGPVNAHLISTKHTKPG